MFYYLFWLIFAWDMDFSSSILFHSIVSLIVVHFISNIDLFLFFRQVSNLIFYVNLMHLPLFHCLYKVYLHLFFDLLNLFFFASFIVNGIDVLYSIFPSTILDTTNFRPTIIIVYFHSLTF